jgi:hypothetical protein
VSVSRREHRAKLLTDPEYERLLAAQGGGCAICGNPPRTRRLSVDHDHRTKRVRGLLCFRCNRALPHYLDADWLETAAAYVAGEDRATRAARFLRLQQESAYPSAVAVERELVRGVPEAKR